MSIYQLLSILAASGGEPLRGYQHKRGVKMAYQHKESDLTVIMRAKDLCAYVFTITQKCPKQFRFTFVSRLQNLTLNVIENLYRANSTFISDFEEPGRRENLQKRLDYQHCAFTELKIMAFISHIAYLEKCILSKQLEQIAKKSLDCERLLGAWITSDRKRYAETKKAQRNFAN